MATQQKQKTKGLPKRVGRGTGKAKRARNLARQPERKLKRLVKHNTVAEAWAWADKKGALAVLRKVLKGLGWPDARIDSTFASLAKAAA